MSDYRTDGEALGSIRSAFAAGDFSLAQKLWEAYATRLHQAILDGLATPQIMADTASLIEWAHFAVKAFQAQAAGLLGAVRVAGIYSRRSTPRAPIIRASF